MSIGAFRLDQRINPQTIATDILNSHGVLEEKLTELKALKTTGTYPLTELSNIAKIIKAVDDVIKISTENRTYIVQARGNFLRGTITVDNSLSFSFPNGTHPPHQHVFNKQTEEKRRVLLVEEDMVNGMAELATLCAASQVLERRIDCVFKKVTACYEIFEEKHDPNNESGAFGATDWPLVHLKKNLLDMKKVALEPEKFIRIPAIRQPFPPLFVRVDVEAAEREVAAEKKAAFEAGMNPSAPAKRKLFRTPEETAEFIKAEEAKDLAAELEAKALAAELDALASEARKNQNQAQPQVEESLPVQQTQAVTEDSQPVQAPMQQVKLYCDAGWGKFVGICCESRGWDKNPIILPNEGTLWFGEVPVGDNWKYVKVNTEHQVIQWETRKDDRKIDTLQEAAIDHSAEVRF